MELAVRCMATLEPGKDLTQPPSGPTATWEEVCSPILAAAIAVAGNHHPSSLPLTSQTRVQASTEEEKTRQWPEDLRIRVQSRGHVMLIANLSPPM